MTALHSVNSVALVVKDGNAAGESLCMRVREWLAARGVPCSLGRHPGPDTVAGMLPGADLVLVFAGDGTMVSVARQCLDLGVPVAGVNFGRVGFLAELSETTWEQALDRALEHGMFVEERMSLRFSHFREGVLLREGEVVNDVVVTRGKVARLVNLNLSVNGDSFLTIRSDGLIFSTPTGSSGYSGSAGGPLMQPAMDAYVVAAICPYLGSFPPLVLAPETVFAARVGEAATDLYLTLDGQEAYAMEEGDEICVSGVPGRVRMANFGLKNYFSRLLRAGFVQETRRHR